MAITADELAAVRAFVPTSWTPTGLFNDAAVTAVWNREASTPVDSTDQATSDASMASIYQVALTLSETMLSVIIGDPDSFSIGGEYSESRGAGINALMAQIARLTALRDRYLSVVAGTSRVVSHQLCRPNFHGR